MTMDNTKIIVVEDNVIYCEFICNLLAKEGFRTQQVYRLSEAKKLLQQATEDDIVVSDLRLPNGDGIDLLRWMRKEGMMQPFIIMTDYDEVHTAVESMKLGSLDYIPKQLIKERLIPLLHDIQKERHIGQNRMPMFPREGGGISSHYEKDKKGCPNQFECADIRREWYGKGAYRTSPSRKEQTGRKTVCVGGLRVYFRRTCTLCFLWSRERGFYWCRMYSERLFL